MSVTTNDGNPFNDYGVSFDHVDSQPTNKAIPKDNLKSKILSCIPIVGAFIELKNQFSLDKKIVKEQDLTFKSRLVKVSNDYKISGIVRNILSITIVVAAVALIILSGGSAAIPVAFAGAAIGISLYSLSRNAYEIHRNKQQIKQWEQSRVDTTDNLASAYGKSV